MILGSKEQVEIHYLLVEINFPELHSRQTVVLSHLEQKAIKS